MIVSIVMPDTGLRAVVAIALAATEVKKKENTRVRTRPSADHGRTTAEACSERIRRRRSRRATTPMRMVMIGMSRSVRSCTDASPLPESLAARSPNEPATMRSDFMMPKMPAVAIAPTPMKRT